MTTTLIAKRTRVGGLIETEGDVVVEGRVEGTIRAGGCVTIGVSGVAVSDVEAGRAMVLGILIGNVTAYERIDVAASARIIGDVRAPAVVVASAGLVEGVIEESPSPDEPKPTLRLRQNPVVRPARSSGNVPVAAAPPPPTTPPPSPQAPWSGSRVDTHAPTLPMRGQSVSAGRLGRPLSPNPLPAPARPPFLHPPATRRPGPPPTPSFEPDDQGDDELPTAPPGGMRGPNAVTQTAEPVPPPIPRPPSRVRLIPRDGIGEEP
jgi:cytoskeletal protein CcmA (bactofilin family)